VNIITTHFDVLAGMDEVKVDKQYFDIEIDENDTIISDYKIKSGVSKKHLALKLLKKKGFDASIIADAEYLYEKLQGFDTKKKNVKEEEKEKECVIKDMIEYVIVVEKGSIDGEVVVEDIIVEKEKEETINLDDIDIELDTTNI
jgi:DNA mismatch repair ATPase MutS